MNAYEREPYRTRLDVTVVAAGEDDGRRWVVLDDTILYPEGGGQPADHGWIGETPIVDVRRIDGEIRHYLDGDPPQGTSPLRLDWRRRFDHMQQHTAQHLLTAIAADRCGWQTASFHLGAEACDIELDVAGIGPEDLGALEEAVAEQIRAALPVSARRVSADEYASLDVRTRGLPEGHSGDIRLVEIAGVDCNTCGGTHLRSTAEIEALALLGTESMRGGTRLSWIAGGRVRRRLHRRESLAATVRLLFETSDDELVETAAGKLDRLKEAERAGRALAHRLAVEAARRLRASADSVIDGHFDDADAAFLQSLARELLAAGDERPALLTASGPSTGFFALCASTRGLDVRTVGPAVADVLAGRGGGSAEIFQGKAGSLERRAEAVQLLREAAAGRD
jgi:Ser-tRNA(Ala) deacylase AlaX